MNLHAFFVSLVCLSLLTACPSPVGLGSSPAVQAPLLSAPEAPDEQGSEGAQPHQEPEELAASDSLSELSELERITALHFADSLQRFFNQPGAQARLETYFLDAAGQILESKLPLTWHSSRPQDFTVDEQGWVTAHTESGYSEISARIPGTEIAAQMTVSINVYHSGGRSGGAGGLSQISEATLRPALSVSGLSAPAGAPGSLLRLIGQGFSRVLADNQVTVGEIPAQVTAVSDTQLTLSVPDGISGLQPVTVQVGSQKSGPFAFEIVPLLIALSSDKGSTGEVLSLTGAGFSPDPAQNTVFFGDTPALILKASPNTLTVSLTEAPAALVPVTVQTGHQLSNALDFQRLPRLDALHSLYTTNQQTILTRSETLILSGSNFDPIPEKNLILFTQADNTTVTAVPFAATAHQLQLTLPIHLTVPGEVQVQVLTHHQASNPLIGLIETLSVSSGGGFY